MNDKRFMNAVEVADILCVSTSKAYKIIQQLNQELKSNGYLTVAGRVSRAYFEKKVYSEPQASCGG